MNCRNKNLRQLEQKKEHLNFTLVFLFILKYFQGNLSRSHGITLSTFHRDIRVYFLLLPEFYIQYTTCSPAYVCCIMLRTRAPLPALLLVAGGSVWGHAGITCRHVDLWTDVRSYKSGWSRLAMTRIVSWCVFFSVSKRKIVVRVLGI